MDGATRTRKRKVDGLRREESGFLGFRGGDGGAHEKYLKCFPIGLLVSYSYI